MTDAEQEAIFGQDGWCPKCGHREEGHHRYGENGYRCADLGASQGKRCMCWRAPEGLLLGLHEANLV